MSWQQQLADAITDPRDLCEMLDLNSNSIEGVHSVVQQFPLRVPQAFISRMEKGNPKDPLLLQALPLGIEMQSVPGYLADPLNETSVNPAAGLLHKYHGRVLLTLIGVCAINCRYCFRRHYPYADKVPGLSQWWPALDYIAADATIEEVILSGGDPLVVKDELLAQFVQQLEAIPHLKCLRIHTRLPIVIPDRVTDELISMLTSSRFKIVMVLHSNHANELDRSVDVALQKCRDITLLNQTVLLKGINDSADALVNLSQRLFEINVLPYYLHLLDPVAGAAHFDVSEKRALGLVQQAANQLPGYLVPKLVREVPEKESKQLMGASFNSDECYQ